MLDHILKWISVFFLSMIKFIGGPLSAASLGLEFWEGVLFTILGMMFSVYLFTYFGIFIRKWYFETFRVKKTIISSKSKRLVTIWRKFGMHGVAFLTPVILSPIGGSLVAVSFGVERKKIFLYMLISAVFWALIMNMVAFYIKSLG